MSFFSKEYCYTSMCGQSWLCPWIPLESRCPSPLDKNRPLQMGKVQPLTLQASVLVHAPHLSPSLTYQTPHPLSSEKKKKLFLGIVIAIVWLPVNGCHSTHKIKSFNIIQILTQLYSLQHPTICPYLNMELGHDKQVKWEMVRVGTSPPCSIPNTIYFSRQIITALIVDRWWWICTVTGWFSRQPALAIRGVLNSQTCSTTPFYQRLILP